MVSVTSASRYITSALHDHPRYQNGSSMYIRGRTLFVAFRCSDSKYSQIVCLHIQNRPDLKMQFDVFQRYSCTPDQVHFFHGCLVRREAFINAYFIT